MRRAKCARCGLDGYTAQSCDGCGEGEMEDLRISRWENVAEWVGHKMMRGSSESGWDATINALLTNDLEALEALEAAQPLPYKGG